MVGFGGALPCKQLDTPPSPVSVAASALRRKWSVSLDPDSNGRRSGEARGWAWIPWGEGGEGRWQLDLGGEGGYGGDGGGGGRRCWSDGEEER